MKKNKLSAYTLVALLVGGLFSCQTDLLDLKPETSYPADQVFNTPLRVEQQVNGLYDAVKDGNFLGGRYHVYSDIRGEEFLNRLTNGVTGLQTWNHTIVESTNEVNNLWLAAYQAVNQINVFLKGVEDNKEKFVQPVFPATFGTTIVNYQAEARFLRGITYYYLLQFYAKPFVVDNGANPGVPLRLKAEVNFENNDLARATVAEVYTQILADLDYAEANLPLTGGVTRAHRNSAIAFKTRVYLTMQNWPKVISEADKIVSAAAPFTAATGTAHALSGTVAGIPTSSETIFSFPFTVLDPPGTQNQLAYYYLPATSSTVLALPTTTAAGNGEYPFNEKAPGIFNDKVTWKPTDARRTAWVRWLYTSTNGVVTDTVYYLNKYVTASPYTDSSPVIRYAEVLLNLSEALVRSTNTVDARALSLLNVVRTRSIADPYNISDPNDFLAALLKERRVEFLGEGLRSIDLWRLNAAVPAKGSAKGVAPTDAVYIWPMPSTERTTNKLLQPN